MRVYLLRCVSAGCQHRDLCEHVLGTVRLEIVHFQRIIPFRGKKRSNLSAKPSTGGARTGPAESSPVPPPPAAGAGVAAVQDNAYFLSLITRFLKKKKIKKISFGSKIVFYDSVGQDGTHVSLSRFMK